MMYAKILGSMSDYLSAKMQITGAPNAEQLVEIMTVTTDVIFERLPELREAVKRHL